LRASRFSTALASSLLEICGVGWTLVPFRLRTLLGGDSNVAIAGPKHSLPLLASRKGRFRYGLTKHDKYNVCPPIQFSDFLPRIVECKIDHPSQNRSTISISEPICEVPTSIPWFGIAQHNCSLSSPEHSCGNSTSRRAKI
jgi:hypothetical protein